MKKPADDAGFFSPTEGWPSGLWRAIDNRLIVALPRFAGSNPVPSIPARMLGGGVLEFLQSRLRARSSKAARQGRAADFESTGWEFESPRAQPLNSFSSEPFLLESYEGP